MTSGVVLSDEFKKTKDLYKKKKYKLFTQKAYNLYIKTKKKSERIELSYLLGMSLKKLSLPLSSAQYLSKVITHSETENKKKFQKSFEANVKLREAKSQPENLFALSQNPKIVT